MSKKPDLRGLRSLVQQLRLVKETKSTRERRRRGWLCRAIEQVESRCLMSGDVTSP